MHTLAYQLTVRNGGSEQRFGKIARWQRYLDQLNCFRQSSHYGGRSANGRERHLIPAMSAALADDGGSQGGRVLYSDADTALVAQSGVSRPRPARRSVISQPAGAENTFAALKPPTPRSGNSARSRRNLRCRRLWMVAPATTQPDQQRRRIEAKVWVGRTPPLPATRDLRGGVALLSSATGHWAYSGTSPPPETCAIRRRN